MIRRIRDPRDKTRWVIAYYVRTSIGTWYLSYWRNP